jgi:predicted transcriptional regulator
MFSIARKQAQQIAQQFLAGHCSLIAWWTLRHAGVLEAMLKLETEKKEGLDPLVHAARTNMAADVLAALLEYLAASELVVFKKDGVHLTADGRALLEHEDGVLELIRAYQPVLEASEHLLAKLKSFAPNGTTPTAGSPRKAEYLADSQAKR